MRMGWLPFGGFGSSSYAGGAADPAMVSFYSQFIAEGDLVFDVGANVGNRVAVFLELGARVVAVEPQKACIKTLRRRFGHEQNFTLEPCSLGARAGMDYLYQSNANTISSMSKTWIDTVRNSGRFSSYHWGKPRRVAVTTLDALILRYGLPKFVKIDVEGYELEVIKGLSQPVNMLSLEFVPEILNPTFEAMQLLNVMGPTVFNYGLGEATAFELDDWVDLIAITGCLSGYRDRIDCFGDVYVRFADSMIEGAG